MATYRYAFFRRSLVAETYFIDADSPEEALQRLRDGEESEQSTPMEWVDWYDDDYTLDEDFEPEPLCPLHKMVKNYDPTDCRASDKLVDNS